MAFSVEASAFWSKYRNKVDKCYRDDNFIQVHIQFNGGRNMMLQRSYVAACLAAATCLAISAAASGALINSVWNGNTASWEDPAQWDPASEPLNNVSDTYFANIPSGVVTVNSAVVVSGVSLQTGAGVNVTAGNTLTLTGAQASTIQGTISTALNGTAILSNVKLGSVVLNPIGTVINSAGVVHFVGSNNAWATGAWKGTGSVIVDAGATLSLPSANGSITDLGFTNNGTVTESNQFLFSTAGNTLIQNNGIWSFINNIGTISSTGGRIVNNGVWNETTTTAAISSLLIATPYDNKGQIFVTSPNNSLAAEMFLTGSGTNSGTVTLSGKSTILEYEVENTLQNATVLGNGRVSGLVRLLGTSSVSNGSFRTITGTGNLDVTSSLEVSLGSQAFDSNFFSTTGVVTIKPGATLNMGVDQLTVISPPVAAQILLTLDTTALVNQGAATVDKVFGGTAAVATISLKEGASFQNAGSLTLNNNLTFNSDGNPGNHFDNTGTIFLGASALTLNMGGTSSGTVNFSTPNTARITFNAPYTLTGGTIGNAAATGLVYMNAPMTINGDTMVYHVWLGSVSAISGSILSGTSKLTVSEGQWVSGTISNAGGLEIAPGATGASSIGSPNFTIPSAAPKVIDGTSIKIDSGASVSWYKGSASISVIPKNQIDFRNGATIVNNGTFYTYFNAPIFNNADGNANNAFYNHGTFGRNANFVALGTSLTQFSVPFYNDGLLDIQQGAIDFSGGYFDISSPGHTASIRFAPGTTLSFSGGSYALGASLNLGPGGLAGTGTVHTSFITSGTISPGNSPGKLDIDGNLTLLPGAVTLIELAGPLTDTGFDHLDVGGMTSLAGSLQLTLLNGYLPGITDSFAFLTTGSLGGAFDNASDGTRVPTSDGAGSFLVSYSNGGVTLTHFTVAAAPEPHSIFILGASSLFMLRRRQRKNSVSTAASYQRSGRDGSESIML